jgi:hypothetical protein
MDTLFKGSSSFASLSLKDLIQARDLFHYHLMNKKNVVATALGLYRIRKGDPWPSREAPHLAVQPRKPKSTRRTLFNSEVRPYSWPCVYAFVSSWETEVQLADSNPSDVVPKTLYLPDGRSVPVCVIEAREQSFSRDLKVSDSSIVPRNLLRPGSAIVNEDGQGMPRVGTVAAIVRDGERYYALTNRHVIGESGTSIYALQAHRRPKIGIVSTHGLTRLDVSQVYPHFQSTQQRLLLDVGLVDLDNILDWKTEVPGIRPVQPVLDLYDNNLTLDLIGLKVVGQAAISGQLRGEIHALFYRFKSMGGSEYLSDFLIGPETYTAEGPLDPRREPADANIAFAVHHGDSGTMLLVEHTESVERQHAKPKASYYPFALLWGREEFFADGTALAHPFALATALAPALDRLNLDLVRDINLDQDYVWGWVGHYIIGRALSVPTDLVTSKKLASFIDKNLDLLSVEPDAALGNDPKVQAAAGDAPQFVPLADVPDNVWKSNVNFTMVPGSDGKKHRKLGPGNRGQDDNKNHFADLDLVYLQDKTFLELNQSEPATYLNPAAWVAYFAAMTPKYVAWAKLMGKPGDTAQAHWGALPFRVHQLFDTMVAAAKQKDKNLFLCAGGTLIHYLGDACQPLHASYLSQGDPDHVVKRSTGTYKLQADGVHSGYEDDMIAYGFQQKGLEASLKAKIKNPPAGENIAPIASGDDAARAVIALIAATHDDIAPRAIVDKWVSLIGDSKKQKAEAMWAAFGGDTVTCMARGTRYLARIWQAAWDAGEGDSNLGGAGACTPGDIMNLYNDPDVVPSVALDRYPADAGSDWSKITHP